MYKSDILLKRSTNILVLSDFVCVCRNQGNIFISCRIIVDLEQLM